jgi:hypothetical protein
VKQAFEPERAPEELWAVIDDEVIRIARNRARIEIRRQDEELKDAIGRVKASAAASGVAGSGIPLLRIASLCADAAVERAELVWRILHRAIATANVGYEPYLESELKSVAEEFLSPHLPDLRAFPREAAQSVGIMPIIPHLEGIVADGQRTGRDRAWNEIELFITFLKAAAVSPQPSRPQVTLNVYAPVGAIQAGDQATAFVASGVDAELRARLAEALRGIERQLEREADEGLEDHRHARERVREARIEAERAEPDRVRLAALLAMASEALRAIVDLRPALDALKAIAESVGIKLPW